MIDLILGNFSEDHGDRVGTLPVYNLDHSIIWLVVCVNYYVGKNFMTLENLAYALRYHQRCRAV